MQMVSLPSSFDEWLRRLTLRKPKGPISVVNEAGPGRWIVAFYDYKDDSIYVLNNEWTCTATYHADQKPSATEGIGRFNIPKELRKTIVEFIGEPALVYLKDPLTVSIHRDSQEPRRIGAFLQFEMGRGTLLMVLERR